MGNGLLVAMEGNWQIFIMVKEDEIDELWERLKRLHEEDKCEVETCPFCIVDYGVVLNGETWKQGYKRYTEAAQAIRLLAF